MTHPPPNTKNFAVWRTLGSGASDAKDDPREVVEQGCEALMAGPGLGPQVTRGGTLK